ncbi:hypothetical protein Lbir_0502 [Legionella birminghamensis]|uniref:Predicted outer membrane protein n=1 Tax=Legionella birminghamensis TaxID=28083 RepID=A0A378IEG7_9GAMM|nr:DUF4142 domain-containing protein [Legionella birminghamensis]KTC75357.1 hypothetical protein Lbir_0502 [Legionella birminghamensis]STX33125.1 Predicted outer membrane protein [Legionella birminghamensis]
MKSKIALFFLLLLGLLQIAAVSQNNPALGPLLQQQDGAVMANLLVLNENQSLLAQSAYKKSTNTMIQKFALQLDQQARHNLKAIYHLGTTTGISTIDAATALKLRNVGKAQVKKLSEMDGVEVDRMYIQLVITNSRSALRLIAHDFQPLASHPALKNYLESSKALYSENIKQAGLIEKALETQ